MNYNYIWQHDSAYWQTISKQTVRDGYVLYTNPALPTRYDPNHAGLFRLQSEQEATHAITDIIAFYEALGCDSVVYLDSYATPSTFPQLLTSHGFTARYDWGITDLLILDAPVPVTATSRIDVVRVSTDEQRIQWASLEEATPHSTSSEMYALRREELRDSAVQGYIAYLDGVPAGRCLTFTHNNICRIESVFVTAPLRRQGVAKHLVSHAVAHAHLQAETVYLFAIHDYHAITLYHALGFHTVMHNVTMTYVRPRIDS